MTSVGDQDDDAMVEEWEHVGDGLKEGPFVGSHVTLGLTLRWFAAIPRDKLHREHPHLAIISDHMSSFLAGFKTPHPSGSDGHKSSGHRHRFGKSVRNILRLPRHSVVDNGAIGGEQKLVPSLEGEDLVWFVGYLDNVSFLTVPLVFCSALV